MSSRSHSESVTDPCRRSELEVMYRELQTQIWADAKDKMLKLRNEEEIKTLANKLIKVKTPPTPSTVDFNLFIGNLRHLISLQETFEEGTKDMLSWRQDMEKVLQQASGMPCTNQERVGHFFKRFRILHFLL